MSSGPRLQVLFLLFAQGLVFSPLRVTSHKRSAPQVTPVLVWCSVQVDRLPKFSCPQRFALSSFVMILASMILKRELVLPFREQENNGVHLVQ